MSEMPDLRQITEFLVIVFIIQSYFVFCFGFIVFIFGRAFRNAEIALSAYAKSCLRGQRTVGAWYAFAFHCLSVVGLVIVLLLFGQPALWASFIAYVLLYRYLGPPFAAQGRQTRVAFSPTSNG